jgi:cell shape-determining protein MreC
MTYLRTHDNRSGRKRAAGWVFAVLAAAVLVIYMFVPHFFPSLFTSMVRPFWRTELSIELGSLQSLESLLQENQYLKRQIADADARLQTIAATEAENQELKAILGRASTTPYILAAVLSHPPISVYDELVIDAGSDLGFTAGDTVYAPGNVPIGTISDVLGQTSKVTLFSSPGQKYQVQIGAAHAPATAVGRGGGQYEADIPRDAKVSAGDFVLAPSLNAKPFGVVVTVLADPAQPFETVLFAPPVNIYATRWVLVDTHSKE